MARTLPDPGRDSPAWFRQLWNASRDTITSLLWADIDKTGSTLADIETRTHSALQSIGEADDTDTDTVKDKHVSNAQVKGYADATSAATTHIAATNAHGATGDLIGAGDLADTGAAGVIVQGAAVADVASADAATQTAGYVQADVQSIATLANETKAQLNALLASLRAGAIDT
jgi:hypothetical protein